MELSEVVILGLASASLFKLVVSDRITQWLRYKIVGSLDRAGGWLPYHLQYLFGCALCFPVWAAVFLYGFRGQRWCQWITVILAARMIGYSLLRWLQDSAVRDWPEGVKFPPEREGK